MNKITALSFVVLASVFLAGCGQQPVSQTQPTASQKSAQSTSEGKLVSTFSDKDMGFEIKYPEDWIYEKAKQDNLDLIAFSFKDEPKDKYIVIGLSVFTRESAINYGATDFLMKNKYEKDVLDLDSVAKIYDEKDFTYNFTDSTTSIGREFKAEYIDNGMSVKKWMILVPNGKKLFMFSYEADMNSYDSYYNIANSMLSSWKISK